MKGLTSAFLIAGFVVNFSIASTAIFHIVDLEDLTTKQTKDIANLKTQLAAKVQPKIKFYTIPGYACDTSEIPGYCSNKYPVTQAEYDKKNSHLFNVIGAGK